MRRFLSSLVSVLAVILGAGWLMGRALGSPPVGWALGVARALVFLIAIGCLTGVVWYAGVRSPGRLLLGVCVAALCTAIGLGALAWGVSLNALIFMRVTVAMGRLLGGVVEWVIVASVIVISALLGARVARSKLTA